MAEKLFITVTLTLRGNTKPETIQDMLERAVAWEIHKIGKIPPSAVEFPNEGGGGTLDSRYGSHAFPN
jgi:hypothetical protein